MLMSDMETYLNIENDLSCNYFMTHVFFSKLVFVKIILLQKRYKCIQNSNGRCNLSNMALFYKTICIFRYQS